MRFVWIFLFFVSCSYVQHDGPTVAYRAVKMSDSVATNVAIDAMIFPYRDSLQQTMKNVLVQNEKALTRGIPECTLGNLIADLLLERAQLEMPEAQRPDICLINIGGLRVELASGAITTRKVFELMPFENELDVLKLSAKKMQEMFVYLKVGGGQPLAGMRLSISKNGYNCTVNGKPWDATRNYYVVTSDYLADGGDKMDFFSEPMERVTTGIKIRDAIIDHFRNVGLEGNTLKGKLDGRLTIK